ncbi:MAG: PEGA domain-containing protein [Deltaproteobacteria bacterium]|nr:PEGA domain-containing protein [Deltaproteobacteria bacterium]
MMFLGDFKVLRRPAAALMFTGLCLFMAAGCSGPLKVTYKAKERPQAAIDAPVSILVTGFADARSTEARADSRTIGKIDATVFDISGNKLTLQDEPAALVTDAFAVELAAAGYDVKRNGAGNGADFILKGEVREFRLDIADRDRIAVEVWSEITEKETGRTIWSGVMAERAERYAGVMGNSKASIEKYINAALSKVAVGAVAEATPRIANTRAAYRPKAEEKGSGEAVEKPVAEGSGRIVIRTEPPRARVYIGGVYYGLTPLSLDMEPGVYDVTIRQRGFKDSSEKVSVRKGEFTELETVLTGE